jgi:hypothetical protein
MLQSSARHFEKLDGHPENGREIDAIVISCPPPVAPGRPGLPAKEVHENEAWDKLWTLISTRPCSLGTKYKKLFTQKQQGAAGSGGEWPESILLPSALGSLTNSSRGEKKSCGGSAAGTKMRVRLVVPSIFVWCVVANEVQLCFYTRHEKGETRLAE